MVTQVLGEQGPPSAFYSNIKEHMMPWKLQPACMDATQVMKWPISKLFFTPEEVSVLTSHNIHQLGSLTNTMEIQLLLRQQPVTNEDALNVTLPLQGRNSRNSNTIQKWNSLISKLTTHCQRQIM